MVTIAEAAEPGVTFEALGAVLFDLDGTLADTTELVMECYRHTMQRHLGEVPPAEEWLRGFGTPLEVQINRFARSAAERRDMLDTYRWFQEEQAERLVRPFAGALETLDAVGVKPVPITVDAEGYHARVVAVVSDEAVEMPAALWARRIWCVRPVPSSSSDTAS